MPCGHCGTIFCDDEAAENSLGGNRRGHCTPQCRKNAANARTDRRRKTEARLKTCQAKRPYWSQGHAQRAARYYQDRFGSLLSPYLCVFGPHWHLTSESSRDSAEEGSESPRDGLPAADLEAS